MKMYKYLGRPRKLHQSGPSKMGPIWKNLVQCGISRFGCFYIFLNFIFAVYSLQYGLKAVKCLSNDTSMVTSTETPVNNIADFF